MYWCIKNPTGPRNFIPRQPYPFLSSLSFWGLVFFIQSCLSSSSPVKFWPFLLWQNRNKFYFKVSKIQTRLLFISFFLIFMILYFDSSPTGFRMEISPKTLPRKLFYGFGVNVNPFNLNNLFFHWLPALAPIFVMTIFATWKLGIVMRICFLNLGNPILMILKQ